MEPLLVVEKNFSSISFKYHKFQKIINEIV